MPTNDELAARLATVEARLDAIEGIGIPIKAMNARTIVPVHFDVMNLGIFKDGIPPTVVKWEFDDNAPTSAPARDATTRYGFNASHAWLLPGKFGVTASMLLLDGTWKPIARWIVTVVNNWKGVVKLPKTGDITDIIDQKDNDGRYFEIQNGGDYTISRPIILKAPLIGAGFFSSLQQAKAKITYTGPRKLEYSNAPGKFYTPTLFTLAPGTCACEFILDPGCRYAGSETPAKFELERSFTPKAFRMEANTSIYGVDVPHIGYFVNLENAPANVTIRKCSGTSVAYFVWVGGGNHTAIYDLDVKDSILEHCVRASQKSILLSVNNCTLQNLDRSEVDPKNIAKGSFTRQDTAWTTSAMNVFKANAGMGPLGEKDGLKSREDRTRGAVSYKDTVAPGFEFMLKHGLDGFALIDLKAEKLSIVTEQPGYKDDAGIGYPSERNIRNGVVKNFTGNVVKVGDKIENVEFI